MADPKLVRINAEVSIAALFREELVAKDPEVAGKMSYEARDSSDSAN